MEYTIKLVWDDVAQVWIVTSDDILGLVLESVLSERARYAVPELLELKQYS